MHRIMFDTGSPIAGSEARESCIYFRPRLDSDTTYITIVYGRGCNAHVNDDHGTILIYIFDISME